MEVEVEAPEGVESGVVGGVESGVDIPPEVERSPVRSSGRSLEKSPERTPGRAGKSPVRTNNGLEPLSPAPPTPKPEIPQIQKEKIPFSEWMERRALELYRARTRAGQLEARKKYIQGVKEQLIKIICKK